MAQSYPSFTPTVHHDVYRAIDPSQPALRAAGKVIFITGGGSGIGKAIALAFAQAHALGVPLVRRTRSTLDAAAVEVTRASAGHTVAVVAEADVTAWRRLCRLLAAGRRMCLSITPGA